MIFPWWTFEPLVVFMILLALAWPAARTARSVGGDRGGGDPDQIYAGADSAGGVAFLSDRRAAAALHGHHAD